ncbi:solute carrier family 22 member 7-like [Ornithodoros turicata]|uniref:solute carrier family 22 member 7-like n=1 Tax=Ornithodoros turicata TaxID=34597 RepID=UPI003139400B
MRYRSPSTSISRSRPGSTSHHSPGHSGTLCSTAPRDAPLRLASLGLISESRTMGSPFIIPALTSGTHSDIPTHNIEDLVRPLEAFDPTVIYSSGPFQVIVLLCTHLAAFCLTCHNLSISLLTPTVNYWCKKPDAYANLTYEEWKNISASVDEAGTFTQCMRYDPPLSVFSLNRSLVECTAWDYDLEAYGQTIVSEWDLVCGRSHLISVSTFCYMSGAMVAAPVAGLLADNLGRRPVICSAAVLLLVFGYASCWVGSLVLFIICRAFVAAGVSAVQVVSFIELFEVCCIRQRDLYCILANTGWIVANLYLKILTLFKLSRFSVQMLIMLPSSLLLWTFYLMTESPRWLIASGDLTLAEEAVEWAARINKVPMAVTRERWAKARELLEIHQLRAIHVQKDNIRDILNSQPLRSRLIILCCCWFCTTFCYYSFWLHVFVHLSDLVQFTAIFLLMLTFLLSGIAVSLYGRRRTLSGALMLFSFATSLLASAVSEEELSHTELSSTATGLLVTAKCFLASALTVMYVYTVELNPTVVRALGTCIAYFAGRIGSALSPFLNELRIWRSNMPFAVLTALSLLCALCVLRLPETTEISVPDTIGGMEQDILHKKLLGPRSRRKKRGLLLND